LQAAMLVFVAVGRLRNKWAGLAFRICQVSRL